MTIMNTNGIHIKPEYTSETLKLLFIILKVLGLIPIENQFFLKTFGSFWLNKYFLIIIFNIAHTVNVVLTILKWYQDNFSKLLFSQFIYTLNILILSLLFLKLSFRWSTIICFWNKIDLRMVSNYGYPRKLTTNINVITGLFSVLSFLNQLASPNKTFLFFFDLQTDSIAVFVEFVISVCFI